MAGNLSCIYLPAVGGIRHSDTILITEDGYENLTHFPTDLASLVITATKPVVPLKGVLVSRAVRIK